MRKYAGLLATAGFVLLPVSSFAAGPTLSDVLTNSGITEAGYIDGSYVASNREGNSRAGVSGLDNTMDSFTLNQVALTLAKQPAEGFGGLVNIIGGNDAKAINGAYGSSTADISIAQAYAQYATGGLTVIAGRFVTLAGEEVIDPTQDTNASRSLLFTNLEPLVHSGVRATYKFSDVVSVVGGLNNSVNGSAVDTNKQKTIEAGVTLAPVTGLTASVVEYYDTVNPSPAAPAPAAPAGALGLTHHTSVTDVVVAYQATTALSFAVNGDYDKLDSNVAGSPSANAKGIALYANYQFCDKLKGSLRGEYLKAGAGYLGTGAPSGNAKEITYTLDYAAAKNFDLLGEARFDHTSSPAFIQGSGTGFVANADSQGTLEVKALYKF